MSRHSTSEKVRASITTIGMAVAASAMSPGMNIRGAKKIMVLITAYMTGLMTLRAPLNAPCGPGSPAI